MSATTISLEPGRYYARWIERGAGAGVRLCCACGYDSAWHLDAFWVEENADRIHGGH